VSGEGPVGGGADPSDSGDSDTPGAESATETEERLSLDIVFEIAKNERRRNVLRFLSEQSGPVSLSDLAEHVAAKENGKTVRELSSGERKRVYVGLYQCHLPKMDDAGVVNFDRNPGITLGPNADQFESYLGQTEESDRPWHQYYAGLTGVGVVLFVTGQLGATMFAALPAIFMGCFLVAMAGCALFHAKEAAADSA